VGRLMAIAVTFAEITSRTTASDRSGGNSSDPGPVSSPSGWTWAPVLRPHRTCSHPAYVSP